MNPFCRSGRLAESQLDGVCQHSLSHQPLSKFRPASLSVPIRYGVDEVLVLLCICTFGNCQRLPTRFLRKARRSHVWDPNLDRPQSLLAKALAVGPDLIAGFGMGSCWHPHLVSMVTCNLPQIGEDCEGMSDVTSPLPVVHPSLCTPARCEDTSAASPAD